MNHGSQMLGIFQDIALCNKYKLIWLEIECIYDLINMVLTQEKDMPTEFHFCHLSNSMVPKLL